MLQCTLPVPVTTCNSNLCVSPCPPLGSGPSPKASWWLTSGGGAWMCLKWLGRAREIPLALAASSTTPMAPVPLYSTTRKGPLAFPYHNPPISALSHAWANQLISIHGSSTPEIAPMPNCSVISELPSIRGEVRWEGVSSVLLGNLPLTSTRVSRQACKDYNL